MEKFKVKDVSLASKGQLQIEWASKHMPVLNQIKEKFQKEKPLKNLTLGACLHVTKETAVLVETFLAGGAKVALCGSNPLSTQDDVAAALAEKGVNVFAWRAQTTEEYYWCIEQVINHKPVITLDDGADLVGTIHNKRTEALSNIKGGTEETTTGVLRLRAMEKTGELKYAIIAVNDAYTKYLFDNRYGTGQSTIDGILRATNILLAGKNFVVCGYGWCGKGIAMRAQGMGANVIITEVNPLRALEAAMNGFRIMPIAEAAKIGDIFVTATGDISVIRKEHMQKMKDGAILANSGHFNVEINMKELEELAVSKRTIRPNLEEYTLKDGRKLYLLAEGRLVNLASAEGHPSEVMDMSFANQALSIEYLAKNEKMPPKVYEVPREVDETVARLKLNAMKIKIDELTEEQKRYLATWEMGTI
ncbi:MAG: adenosylhomocysteinase [Candidatus Bathyarchaeota archaeon]|nr:adenosylhomocysteinase [Candidatus Bathyarchaeota archaeon]MDI6805684.1 adenosylhomocysteinase [Candidatus Bathyarchaeia archaeon]